MTNRLYMKMNTAEPCPVSAGEMESLGIRIVDPVMDTCLHSRLPGVWLLHAAEPGESVKRSFSSHHEVAEGRWQIEMDRVWLDGDGAVSPLELLERRLDMDRAYHAGRRSGEGVPQRVRHYGFPYGHGVELAHVLVDEDKEHLPSASGCVPRPEPFAPPVSAGEMEEAGIVVVGGGLGGYGMLAADDAALAPCLWAERTPREWIEDDCRVVPRLHALYRRRAWECRRGPTSLHVVPDRVWLRGTPDPLLYLEYWMRYYERMGEDRGIVGRRRGRPGRRPRHYGFPYEHGVELATVWVSDVPEPAEGGRLQAAPAHEACG